MRHPIRVLSATILSLTMFVGCDSGGGAVPGTDAGPLTPLPDGAVPDVAVADTLLERCDIRGANASYDGAWREDPNNGAAALGFALTDMLRLGEDPHAVAGLQLFGFTGAIDGEDMLYGPSGLLDDLNRHVRSSEYGDRVKAIFPYPPVRESMNGFDRIALDTTALDVMTELWGLQARIDRISEGFELAADQAPRTVTIAGICNVGRVEMQAPELYALAATWRLFVFVIQLSRGYDWNFTVRDALDGRDGSFSRLQQRADTLNTHLGAISDASALPAVREEWRHLTALLTRAIDTADAASVPGPDALSEWRAFRAGLLPDMHIQSEAAHALADGPATAPGLTPTFVGDMGPLFDAELDLADFGRTFTAYEDPMWGDTWIEVEEAPIDALLMAVVSPSPFDDSLSNVEWSHLDRWEGSDAEWQITEIPSTRPSVGSARVPRFMSQVMVAYRDRWYFGP